MKFSSVPVFVSFSVLAALLSACQQPEPSSDSNPPVSAVSLKGTTWILTSIVRADVPEMISDSMLRLTFDGSGGVGFKGCNQGGGNYVTGADSSIQFTSMTQTLMACVSPTLMRGDSIAQSLSVLPLYYRFGGDGTLLLRRGDVELRFKDSAYAN